jgi:2-octaprenyl-6-methoxyphenol hydroxylase
MRAEVAIRGAGPVGCVFALAAHASGKSVVLQGRRLFAEDSGPAPLRPIALSHASRLILERVGAWHGLAVTPIESIHVSRQGGFGRVSLGAADAGVPALGYVTDYGALLNSLFTRVEASGIRIETEPEDAPLVVHAEGTSSALQGKSYGQEAVVALVTTSPTAARTAWERFTPEGPLALLPLGERYCTVWGMRPERAQALCDATETEFLEALARAFGGRAGTFRAVGERGRVPLALRVRPSRVGVREACIGNAAQTLHPVAGQGLNLGLRDAWDLARVLRDAEDPGDAHVLARFARMRRFDAMATVRATDFLAGAFLGTNPLSGLMRGIGLTALDSCLPARRFFARRMIYGMSALP